DRNAVRSMTVGDRRGQQCVVGGGWWTTVGKRNMLRRAVVDHRRRRQQTSVDDGGGPSRTAMRCGGGVVDHRRGPQRASVDDGGGPSRTGTQRGERRRGRPRPERFCGERRYASAPHCAAGTAPEGHARSDWDSPTWNALVGATRDKQRRCDL